LSLALASLLPGRPFALSRARDKIGRIERLVLFLMVAMNVRERCRNYAGRIATGIPSPRLEIIKLDPLAKLFR
jgi:hypothetical protein